MKSKFIVLFILFLIGINFFLLRNFYLYKKNYIKGSIITSQNTDKLITLQTNLVTAIKNNNIHLKNILVKDSLNNVFYLHNIFSDKRSTVLICRFSEMNCESCINYSINNLLQCSNSIGKNNILFLGAYRNNKILNKQKSLYGIDNFEVLNSRNLSLPAENLGYPYYIILDSTLEVLNVFVPSKKTPQFDHEYLNLISKRYFKSESNKDVY